MSLLKIVLAATALLPVAGIADAQRGPDGGGRWRGGDRGSAQQTDGERSAPQRWNGGGERAAQPGGPQGRGGWTRDDARPAAIQQPQPSGEAYAGRGDRPRFDADRGRSEADQQRGFRADRQAEQARWGQPGDRTQFNRRGDDRGWTGNRDWNGNRGWNGNGNRGWNDNRRFDDRGAWNRTWRNDDRYDWTRYRNSNRSAYRLPRYYAPYGWSYGYRRFGVGATLSSLLWGENYWIEDPYSYRLPDAYGPYRWVRYYGDALLVDVRTGRVVDVVYDIFG